MTSKTPYLIVVLLCLGNTTVTQAQFLNKLKNRAMEKIGNKIEDRVVEEVSDKIVQSMMKPIDTAFDNMVKESYKEQSGNDYSYEQLDSLMNEANSNYAIFLEEMNQSVELPAQYNFAHQITIESKEEDGRTDIVDMWFDSEGTVMGIKQQGSSEDFVIIDMKNDIVTLYSEEDGKKTAQAIPAMMKLTGTLAASYQIEMEEMTIEGPGESKTIQGFEARKYTVDTETDMSEFYVCNELPFSWHEGFFTSIMQYAPGLYGDGDNLSKMEGVILEGVQYDKETKGKSYMETTSIMNKAVVISNEEYERLSIMGN